MVIAETQEVIMSLSFSIRVIDDDGYGVSGVGVGIDFGFVGLGFAFETEYTGDDGWAEFDLGIDDDSIYAKTIFVGGDEVDSGVTLGDGSTHSYTRS
jgi:hypothetical protein